MEQPVENLSEAADGMVDASFRSVRTSNNQRLWVIQSPLSTALYHVTSSVSPPGIAQRSGLVLFLVAVIRGEEGFIWLTYLDSGPSWRPPGQELEQEYRQEL